MRSLTDIDFNSKGGVKKSNETIDYSASEEPTLNSSKEDTLKGHISYLAKGIKWIKSQFSKYLPLTGGTMGGAIDMNKNPFKTAGFETVTALPTTNLFVGRKVVMNGIEYTYNGVTFIANGINTIDKIISRRNLTTLTSDEISYNDIIYNSPFIYASSFNSTLESFAPEVVEKYADNSWQTTNFPNAVDSSNTPIRFTMFENPVTAINLGSISSIFMWTRNYGYRIHIKIEYRSYNTDTQTYDWFTVKELDCVENSCIIPLPQKTLYPSVRGSNSKGLNYIDNVRITISLLNNSLSFYLRGLKFNTTGIIPLTDVKFDINYNALIKPTQSGNTVTKTNNWVLQYLTQGVHWLRDNKVETNTDATLKSLTIKNASNNQVDVSTTTASLISFSDSSGNVPFVIRRNTLEIVPGSAFSNQISLGLRNQYWKEVWAGKYKIPGGTSSQFLKADGSVDSNSYQTVISDLATIRTNATNGNTAYGWGNHVNAGYAKTSDIPTELPPTDNSVTTAKITDNSISTSKIQNEAITLDKLATKSFKINGQTINLGDGLDSDNGVVTLGTIRDGLSLCIVNLNGNKLTTIKTDNTTKSMLYLLSAPASTVATSGDYNDLNNKPTIPNPTANPTEITNVNNWFDANINSYIIPEDLMYRFLSGNAFMSDMLLQLNDASCTLTSYNLDFRQQGVSINTLISNLTTREGYEVYVENDIDSITTNVCTLKFKIDGHRIIIECYKKIV